MSWLTAADKAVEVVTRIVYPGRRELGDCLTQCEASELDEGVVNADGIATGDARVTERTSDDRVRSGPAERRIPVGADHAVLGRGTRIDVEVFAGASAEVVA